MILRLALGLTACVQGGFYFTAPSSLTPVSAAIAFLLSVTGLGILSGFLTPACSGAAALVIAAMAVSLIPLPESGPLQSRSHAAMAASIAAALVLLGPGSLSLDARLFGRREIIIPSPPNSIG